LSVIPQRSKVLPSILLVVGLIYLMKNPVAAAHTVHQVIDAVSKFAGAL
jgi:hypothetical protein